MNYKTGVEPPKMVNRADWSEHLSVLRKNEGGWVEFDFSDDPELGYRFYRRLVSSRNAGFTSSVSGKGSTVKAVFNAVR